MNTSYLTWSEARSLALAGQLVRREAWTNWLRHSTGIWELVDSSFAFQRVVSAGDFLSADALAGDWTTDAPGTARDVCARAPQEETFSPPGIGLTGEPGTATIDLHADIGDSMPAGVYTIRFFLEGSFVGTMEAATPGRYTLTTEFSPSSYSSASRITARIEVHSELPLPEWKGTVKWEVVLPATAAWTAIDLAADFPGIIRGPGAYYGARTYGPFASNLFVYSHAANPAVANDDLAINGILLYEDNVTDAINGGTTTLLLFLPAGRTFTVDIRNRLGSTDGCGGGGTLRLYNRPV